MAACTSINVERVAGGAPSGDDYQRVAWLHDVIEDSDASLDDLRGRLHPDELEALRLLTHDDPAVTYDDYVEAITAAQGRAGLLARAVKQADMLDNLSRCARDHDPAVAQYGRALGHLWTASAS